MQGTRLSIWPSAVRGYRDAWRALLAMPALAGAAFVIGLAEKWAFQSLPTSPLELDVSRPLKTTISLVASFWRVPILIAVHRFVLLQEVTPRYRLDLSDPRFRRFLGWFLTVGLVAQLTGWLGALARPANPGVGLGNVGWLVLSIILAIVGFFFVMRLTILFPAIAVDAPGATWRSAYEDTRGHVSRIFGIILLAMLPVLPVMLLLLHAAPLSAARFTPPAIASTILDSSVNVFCTILLVAIASRVYQRVGDHVNQPGR